MKFRIIAIPLALSKKSLSRTPQSVGKPFPLVYYHFQTFPSGSEDETPPNILRRAVNKATGAWASMGKAPEGNWKVCSFLGIIISSYFAPGFRV
jgi:hypothetical protein